LLSRRKGRECASVAGFAVAGRWRRAGAGFVAALALVVALGFGLAAPAAATRLLRFIANDATPAGSSIRACDAILKHAERGFQLDVIEARLRKLEKHYRSREDRSES